MKTPLYIVMSVMAVALLLICISTRKSKESQGNFDDPFSDNDDSLRVEGEWEGIFIETKYLEFGSETEELSLDWVVPPFKRPEQGSAVESLPLNNVNYRKMYIGQLLLDVKRERDIWYDMVSDDGYTMGLDDGSGLLYQSTPSYQKLLMFCSERELLNFHEAVSPWSQYVAVSN